MVGLGRGVDASRLGPGDVGGPFELTATEAVDDSCRAFDDDGDDQDGGSGGGGEGSRRRGRRTLTSRPSRLPSIPGEGDDRSGIV